MAPSRNENDRRPVKNLRSSGQSTTSTVQLTHAEHHASQGRQKSMRAADSTLSRRRRPLQVVSDDENKASAFLEPSSPPESSLHAWHFRLRSTPMPGAFPHEPSNEHDANKQHELAQQKNEEEKADEQYPETLSSFSIHRPDVDCSAIMARKQNSGQTTLQQRITAINESSTQTSHRAALSTLPLCSTTQSALSLASLQRTTKPAASAKPAVCTKPERHLYAPRGQKRRFAVDLTDDADENMEYREVDEDEARRLIGLPVKAKGEVDLTVSLDKNVEDEDSSTKASRRLKKQ